MENFVLLDLLVALCFVVLAALILIYMLLLLRYIVRIGIKSNHFVYNSLFERTKLGSLIKLLFSFASVPFAI